MSIAGCHFNQMLTHYVLKGWRTTKKGITMLSKQRTNKITELMAGKDHLERGMSILNRAGYTQHSHVAKRVQCGIDLLRVDITGLQLGTLPMATVNEEQAA